MADEFTRSPGSPGTYINDVHAAVREEVEREYAARLADMRKQVRRDQDQADADRICAVREQMSERMADYRRGRWYHLAGIGASAVAGFSLGYFTQRGADLRVKGAPVLAVCGLPGVIGGAAIDEHLALRASLMVGGAMFSAGTVAYALIHPEPPAASEGEMP